MLAAFRIAVAFLSLVAISCSGVRTPAPTSLPTKLPAPLESDTSLGALIQGRVAVLDLWASWCPACTKSIPKLTKLKESYRDRGLVVAGIGVGEPADRARRLAIDKGINYPLFVDTDFSFADGLAAREVPTILLVDRDGRIIARARAVDQDLVELLERTLSQSPPSSLSSR